MTTPEQLEQQQQCWAGHQKQGRWPECCPVLQSGHARLPAAASHAAALPSASGWCRLHPHSLRPADHMGLIGMGLVGMGLIGMGLIGMGHAMLCSHDAIRTLRMYQSEKKLLSALRQGQSYLFRCGCVGPQLQSWWLAIMHACSCVDATRVALSCRAMARICLDVHNASDGCSCK